MAFGSTHQRVLISPVNSVIYPEDWKPSTEDWCVTQVKMSKFSYVWTITNFSVFNKMRECLESSLFPASGLYKWCLRLNLKYNRDKYYDIKLVLVQSPVSSTRAEIKMSFLNSKGDKVNSFEPQTAQNFYCGQEDGYIHRFTKDEITKNNLLSEDKLTIFVEVNIIFDKVNKTSQTYMANFRDPECKLIEEFGSILEKGKFYDVILAVNGHELHAHKAILAARSSVFAAMFEHEMQENDKNVVTITDINYNAVKEMLQFIYTGKAPKIDLIALDLLAAADKYALGKLKSMCEVALYRTLTPDTAAETLILADLHGAKQLKEQTINFIKAYTNNVEKTESWRNLIKEHPKLIAEIRLK